MYKGIIEENGVAKLMQVWVYSLLSVMLREWICWGDSLVDRRKNSDEMGDFLRFASDCYRYETSVNALRKCQLQNHSLG